MYSKKQNKIAKHKLDEIAMLWLGKRGVVQTILEDYRGQDVEAEIQEIQQFLKGDDREEQLC